MIRHGLFLRRRECSDASPRGRSPRLEELPFYYALHEALLSHLSVISMFRFVCYTQAMGCEKISFCGVLDGLQEMLIVRQVSAAKSISKRWHKTIKRSEELISLF